MITMPIMGSASGNSSTTTLVENSTIREVNTSVRVCRPPAINAAEPMRRSTPQCSAVHSFVANKIRYISPARPNRCVPSIEDGLVEEPLLSRGNDCRQSDQCNHKQPSQVLSTAEPIVRTAIYRTKLCRGVGNLQDGCGFTRC